MIELRNSAAIVLTASLGFAGAAGAAAVPPNVVASDSQGNTAMGTEAMGVPTTGTGNTAVGYFALDSNNDGLNNTAVGTSALTSNNDGSNNTAVGFEALVENNADGNTGLGYQALLNNTSGINNTAVGAGALSNNLTGHQNGANGYQALFSNKTGSNNIAEGANSLRSNISGGNNIGLGVATLQSTTTGQNNMAIGANALTRNVSGSSNTAIGAFAGFNITGKNNIDIGNEGTTGESGVIRIGTAGTQTDTFVAGISAVHLTGAAVYVASNGQLGVLASSERYKTAIQSLPASTAKLKQLRPVTFHLKTEPNGLLQYGLIAEEVVKVYPDLVIRDENGRIDGVRYDEIGPILLSEVQRQAEELAALRAQVSKLEQQTTDVVELKKQMAELLAADVRADHRRLASR